VSADGALVHARGGDGQQPLHLAKSVAIADFLLERGAGIDARCIDHHSTPAQYALVERTEVCRRLLDRGATPDIFMAAHLGDVALATRLLDADPGCVAARSACISKTASGCQGRATARSFGRSICGIQSYGTR
jgi:hypothetical protein